VRQEFLQGIALPLASDGHLVYSDDFDHVSQRLAASGRLRRRISKGDCDGPVTDFNIRPGRVLFLCSYLPDEEEARTLPPGPPPETLLLAADSDSGRIVWRRHGSITGPLATAGKQLFITDGDRLLALAVETGRILWQVTLPGHPAGGPASGAGRVFLQNSRGDISARDAGNGRELWRRRLAGRVAASPAVGKDRIFITRLLPAGNDEETGSSRVSALDISSGQIIWQRHLDRQETFFPPTTTAELLLLTTMGTGDLPGQLYALVAADGSIRWRQPLSCDCNGHDFTPVVHGEEVLVWSGDLAELRRHAVSSTYYLVAFNLEGGQPRWRFRPPLPGKFMLSPPLVGNGRLIFADGSALRAYALPHPPGKRSRHRR